MKEVIRKLTDILRQTEEVEQATLFGSQARGDACENSDTDVLVSLRDELPDHKRDLVEEKLRIMVIQAGIAPEELDLVITSHHTFLTHPGELFQNIQKEGKTIYQRNNT